MLSRVVQRKQPRRRLLTVLAAVGLVAGTMLATGTALAIHGAPPDGSLELDGNVADNLGDSRDDWNNFYPTAPANTSTFETTGIITDPDGATIFTGAQSGGSSKDGQDISGWRWKCGSVPPKDEILHAAVAKYTVGTDKQLYFMGDREAVNGDSHIGVWFFRKSITNSGAATCPNAGTFSDVHTAGQVPHSSTNAGDILVLADFTNGGANVTIKVFEWVGSGGNDAKSNGALNNIGFGVNCVGLPAHPAGTPELCATSNTIVLGPGNGADNAAGTADDGPDWPFPPNNNAYPINAFFEGGMDLNSLGLQGACFGSVLTETRSSDETNAILKDFVVSPFEPCTSGITTTASASVNVGGSISDTATVTGSGAGDPTGTVTFTVCGPFLAPTACTTGDSTAAAAGVRTLQTDGTPGNPAIVTSNSITVNSAGYYCFLGAYSGGGGYQPGTDSDITRECVLVTRRPSAVTTDVHNATHAVITNTSVTQGTVVHDKATVTGGGTTPTGSATFTLYSTIDCTGAARTGPPTNPETVALGADGTAESTAWTPDAGVYSYKASYGGDAQYLPSTDSACEPLTVINPTTTFNKTASPVVTTSTTVTYSFAEKNDGSVPLNPPTAGVKASVVADNQCDGAAGHGTVTYVSGDAGTLNVLDAGETWNFTCSQTYTGTGTFTNIATGHGIDPVGKDVTYCANTSSPPDGVRCDQDERDSTSVTVAVTVTTDQGKP